MAGTREKDYTELKENGLISTKTIDAILYPIKGNVSS